MTPSRRGCARAISANWAMSSRRATPPEAISRAGVALSIAVCALKLGPVNMPSVAMSVWIIVWMPRSHTRRASSSARTRETFFQPSTATRPSRASMPTASRSAPKRCTRPVTNSGSWQARVPTTTRRTPAWKASSISLSVRKPPPSCTCRPVAAIRATCAMLRGTPSNAPSKSTTWTHCAPAA